MLILQSWITTLVDAVIWIPSVLGLSPGDVTITLEIRTVFDRAMIKCICWLFRIVRPLTYTFELESIVSACKYKEFVVTYNQTKLKFNNQRRGKQFIPLVRLCKATRQKNKKDTCQISTLE